MTDDGRGVAGTADAADGPSGSGRTEPPLLRLDDLRTHFPITEGLLRREVGRVRAVDGVSLRVERGETVGLVGESGSGKTTTAHSVVGLAEPTGGEIWFDGDRVAELSGKDRRAFRRRVQLVVQDPNDAFNPRMTVGAAVAEPLELHGMQDADRRRRIVEDLLERVGLSADDADRYPHAFSGGEKQRIAIARALVLNPDLVVADEPTSALDGRVQADVLDLLSDVRREFDVSLLFVSHDVDVVERFCDRVAVMYHGEIVEKGPVDDVFGSPAHPYTRLLLGSVPSLDPADREFDRPLTGAVPDPADPPSGCRFHPRCPEIIPPADVDVSRDCWRAITALRLTLDAADVDGVLPGDVSVSSGDPKMVRDAFGIPPTIPDEDLERAVDRAIEAVLAGRPVVARDRLDAAVPSVCEEEPPAVANHENRPVRCHRYDPAVDGEPLPWSG